MEARSATLLLIMLIRCVVTPSSMNRHDIVEHTNKYTVQFDTTNMEEAENQRRMGDLNHWINGSRSQKKANRQNTGLGLGYGMGGSDLKIKNIRYS